MTNKKYWQDRDLDTFTLANYCRLLITFANSLDADQARQNVGPDLDLNC